MPQRCVIIIMSCVEFHVRLILVSIERLLFACRFFCFFVLMFWQVFICRFKTMKWVEFICLSVWLSRDHRAYDHRMSIVLDCYHVCCQRGSEFAIIIVSIALCVMFSSESSDFYPYTWWAQPAPSEKYGGGIYFLYWFFFTSMFHCFLCILCNTNLLLTFPVVVTSVLIVHFDICTAFCPKCFLMAAGRSGGRGGSFRKGGNEPNFDSRFRCRTIIVF